MSSYILQIPGIRGLVKAMNGVIAKNLAKKYIGKHFYFRGDYRGVIDDVMFNERLNIWDPYVVKAVKTSLKGVWYAAPNIRQGYSDNTYIA